MKKTLIDDVLQTGRYKALQGALQITDSTIKDRRLEIKIPYAYKLTAQEKYNVGCGNSSPVYEYVWSGRPIWTQSFEDVSISGFLSPHESQSPFDTDIVFACLVRGVG